MFEDDEFASATMYFFKTLQFQYNGMSSKPAGYHYEKLKDRIKWAGLKAKDFVPLIDEMFYSFLGGLPTKK